MNKENHNKEKTDFFHQKELAFVGIYICQEYVKKKNWTWENDNWVLVWYFNTDLSNTKNGIRQQCSKCRDIWISKTIKMWG